MKPRVQKKISVSPPAAKRRRPLLLGALAVIGGAAAVTAFFWLRPAQAPVQRGENFNVILISMDTTRADHLGCYGQKGIQTPNIDRLAAEGALFEQCTATTPITLPSHASMMTGTYPFVHGARNNGQFYLPAENETLAETLKQAGYATGAEVAAFVLNREFGLNQGFDSYRDVQAATEEDETPSAHVETQRSAEEISGAAAGWLRANATKPFFLFLHFFDPHQPYTPPKRFAAQYPNDPYKGEIAYVDEQIGRLLAELKQLNLDRKTLIILTADHGEGRGAHGEETHGHLLYDGGTLHVPLILRCLEHVPAGVRVAGQVRSIDIAPTVLDFVKQKPLAQAQGTSLLPFIERRADNTGLAAYSETLVPLYDYGYSPLRSWRADSWKYIHAPQPELYDVRADPGELNNLAAQQPQRVAQMREQLRGLIKNAPTVAGAGQARHTLEQHDRAALQSLGYVGGGATTAPAQVELELFEPVGANPKDHIQEIDLTGRAVALAATGQHAKAEQAFRELLARSSSNPAGAALAHAHLGHALAVQGKLEEAIAHYRTALQSMPGDGMVLTNLGEALFKSGQLDEAAQTYRMALQSPPVFVRTHQGLGVALAAAGKTEEALAQFRLALQLAPKNAAVHAHMGLVYGRTQRLPEAITAYNRALELNPGQLKWRRELAEFLLLQGRADEALQQLQPVLRANPRDALAHADMGQAYKLLNVPDQAIVAFSNAVRIQPKMPPWWNALADLLLQQRRYTEAADALRTALKTDPQNGPLAGRLAWLLATCSEEKLRNGAEAVRLAEIARQKAGDTNPQPLDILAAALAEAGRFEEAARAADEALRLAETGGNTELAQAIQARRELYQAQKPYRAAP